MKGQLPYKYYTIPVLIFSVLGLLASMYLSLSHYRNYTDIAYSSFCAISKSINCDTVSQSPWSFLFGIPVAIWGVFSYLLFLVICIPAQMNKADNRYLWDLLFLLALIFSIADIYFGYVAAIKIKAYCIICLLTYAVSFSLLFFTWIIRRRFNSHSITEGLKKSIQFFCNHKKYSSFLIFLFLTFGSLKLFMPAYWIFTYPPLSESVHSGTTINGNPWIGARNPRLIIHEYTDYQCFQCSKMHLILRTLVNEHPDKIRLVHYHYPMDEKFNTVLIKEPFHTGSGALALLAIASNWQGKFWETNDALYAIARQEITLFNIRKFSGKLELDEQKLKADMYSEKAVKILEHDIRTGLKNNIIGTPSYIVDDKVYPSHLPPEILKKIIDE